MLIEKILVTKTSYDTGVTATGVQCSADNDTKSSTVQAKQEVILCSCPIGSPQILELSGIGNPDFLRTHGIDVATSNDNLGDNLQGHIYVPIA